MQYKEKELDSNSQRIILDQHIIPYTIERFILGIQENRDRRISFSVVQRRERGKWNRIKSNWRELDGSARSSVVEVAVKCAYRRKLAVVETERCLSGRINDPGSLRGSFIE